MRTYEKIETVFKRDIEGTKKLIPNKYRNETVEYLKDSMWYFTEKIDGTNIRVMWDGHNVSFGGRTDKAQIPKHLLKYLEEKFKTTEAEELFEQTFGEKEVILFGEGYGCKIQNGGAYRDDVSFILFDVLIGDNYQSREWVVETAKMFNVEVVPVILRGTINDGIEYVMGHHKSSIGNAWMEGVVGRPAVELKDRCGNRVIVKIKWEDFKHWKAGEQDEL